MTTEPTPNPNAARLERTYDAPAELIWELLTTAAGLQEWWAPDGFETRVSELELRPGGQLRYTMTATAPEQVAFMRGTGNPLSTELRKTFTEVAPPTRLAYLSLIDFVPDHEPYEHLTTIDIEPAGDRTNVVMTVDPLHDETWTQQHRAHRGSELDNLEAAIRRRAPAALLLEQACGRERPVVDLPDDLLLAGVVLHDVLSARVGRGRRLVLGGSVAVPLVRVAAEPVTEDPVPHELGAVEAENMEIARRLVRPQRPVAIPPGLPDYQTEPDRLQRRYVVVLAAGVGHRQVDVDDGLRRQPGD